MGLWEGCDSHVPRWSNIERELEGHTRARRLNAIHSRPKTFAFLDYAVMRKREIARDCARSGEEKDVIACVQTSPTSLLHAE